MKKMLVLLFCANVGWAQEDFVRGIFMFGDVKADFQWLQDSLYLNWVQGEVDRSDGTKDLSILANAAGLHVAGISFQGVNLYETSAGQRMIFEAEQAWELPLVRNYFSTRPDSVSRDDNGTRLAISGLHVAGLMVGNPVPDNEYRYDSLYVASYYVKRTAAQSGNPEVGRLEAWCTSGGTPWLLSQRTLYNDDFSTNDFEVKTLAFDLTSAPPTAPYRVLLGGGALGSGSSGCKVDNEYYVDIRFYWSGNVTTWLDKVIVEDSVGQRLFSGTYDSGIQSSALDFKTNYDPPPKYVPM